MPDELDIKRLSKTDPEAYAKEAARRYALPPKEPGFPVRGFFGCSPECTEPGCRTGVVMLLRNRQNRLEDYAYCLLCARRYVVTELDERRKQEGF